MDAWLSGAFALAVLLETALRPELAARPMSVALGLLFAGSVWFRRKHPLATTTVAFGLAAAATVVHILREQPEVGPYTGACVLLLPYTLFRWGAHRDMGIGLLFMAMAYVASALHQEMANAVDAIGAAVVMLFPATIGLVMRFRATAQTTAIEHAKALEREQLARELHDSVAHHVTAMTIQAQAGRARPEAASEALAAIEDEARRTLAELREIVGGLRDATTAPQGRIADIAGLARDGTLPVHVDLNGDLNGLPDALQRTAFRLAQEAITNALKHARNATRMDIRVVADNDSVQITAQDDGDAPAKKTGGFGLIGMRERAALLGGTFEAGPYGKGWRVKAILPRKGAQ